jgi:hypothetical protein
MGRIELVTESTCWIYMGTTTHNGYGQVWVGTIRKNRPAHRVVWEAKHGPVPPGMVLDHLCRVRCCVNPAHLEPVSPLENLRRGESFAAREHRQTHCVRGHEFAGDNVRIYERRDRRQRVCVTCMRTRRRRERDEAAA